MSYSAYCLKSVEKNSCGGAKRHLRKRFSKSTSVFESHTIIYHTYFLDDDGNNNNEYISSTRKKVYFQNIFHKKTSFLNV